MSVETTDLLFDRDVVIQLSEKQGEPKWMLDSRLKALEKASVLSLPKVEKTSIRFWNFTEFAPYTEEGAVTALDRLPSDVQAFVEAEGARNLLLQHHSSVVYTELMPELKAKGVIFTDLHTALREHGDLVKQYFMREGFHADEHRLAALHGALWSGGVFLYVPKNVEIDVPVQSLLWTDRPGVGVLPHLLIVAEANSRVTYLDTYLSTGSDAGVVHNGMTEIYAGPGAKVQYATLHHYGEGVTDVTYRRAVLDRDARVDWVLGELNNGNTISDNMTFLNGTGSESYVKSIAVGSGKQNANITSNIRHFGTHTSSNILARAVMKDDASGIVNSITKIERGATKADGQQTGRMMILSENARGDANPILLIEENDVIAGHAASVGQIDPYQLYYLMSRGITREEAERLIVFGFLRPLLEDIPIAAVVEQMERVIERKLR